MTDDRTAAGPDADRITVLEPQDEYPHVPDAASNYNESMYVNAFDLGQEAGGWFRIGNRVNEGYAEVSVCVYLPDGRVGFVYGRPKIETNERMAAAGLAIEVVTPFEHLTVSYDGSLCLLDNPKEMANPREAFANNPMVAAEVALDLRGVSPMFGGQPKNADGSEIVSDSEKSFAKAHYEQHIAATGSITVDGEVLEIEGLGLRDKSWGPRYWQALSWYRWLPMVFSDDFAMMISIVGRGEGAASTGGMVLIDDEYHLIRECSIDTSWDEDNYQTAMAAQVTTDHHQFEVTGEVMSLIPLRNRRPQPDGTMLHTRITEAMTRFSCDGRTGIGMSEYLDQIEDGKPVGRRHPQG